MTNNQISLHVSNTSIRIDGKLHKKVYKELKKAMGYRPEGAFFMARNNKKMEDKNGNKKWEWDGYITTVCYNRHFCKCSIKKDGTHLPTGLYSRLVEFLGKFNISYKVIDERVQVKRELSLSMSNEYESRSDQHDTVIKAVQSQRWVIKAATGSGKSLIGAELITKLGVTPFIFYVPSIDLLLQARDEFSKFIVENGAPLKVGAIGGGLYDIQDVNIMTIQTAVRALGKKYVKCDDEDIIEKKDDLLDEKKKEICSLIQSAKGLIGDECQYWSSESCQIISDSSVSCFYKYAMSATPTRDLGDDILIDSCFGKVIANISASYLIKKKYLVKPNIYFVKIEHPKYKESHYQNIYKKAIVENPVRNNCIASLAKKFADQGRTVLILCKYIVHGELLNELIDGSVFLHGSFSGKIRKEHIQKMREKKANITLATSIFDEGIDCKPLDTLILAGSGKSSSRALQRIGRTLRPYPGKTHSIIVDFDDDCKYLSKHSKRRYKIYKTEPEFEIERI